MISSKMQYVALCTMQPVQDVMQQRIFELDPDAEEQDLGWGGPGRPSVPLSPHHSAWKHSASGLGENEMCLPHHMGIAVRRRHLGWSVED
jgi:hypothetical protein